MISSLVLLLGFIVTFICYYIGNFKLIFPSFILSATITFQLLLTHLILIFQPYYLYEPNDESYFIYSCLLLIVLISTIIGLATRKIKPIELPRSNFTKKGVINTILILSTLSAPFALMKALSIAQEVGIINTYISIRMGLNSQEYSLGVFEYFSSPLIIIILRLFQDKGIYTKKRQNILLIYSILLCVFYMTINTGRTGYLLLITAILGVKYSKKNISFRSLFFSITGFFFIFFSFGLFSRKGGSVENTLKENMLGLFENFSQYIVTPFVAFSIYLEDYFIRPSLLFGQNTFRIFYAVLGKFSDKIEANEIVQEFVQTPYPTNVYGALHYYISDFGITYGLFICLLIFILLQWIYFNRSNKDIQLLYSLTIYYLIMFIFQDQFLSILSTWIQFFIYIKLTNGKKARCNHS